jgi:autotransporter-associated beta strand protein
MKLPFHSHLLLVSAMLLKFGSVYADSWRSVLYPVDWVPPVQSSFESDKLIQDFSFAGYRRGNQPVPNVSGPLFNVLEYGADPLGLSDSTTAIQNAINNAEDTGGGVVYMPAGTYRIQPQGDNRQTLRIRGSGVVLRGAGVNSTFLLNSATDMRNKNIIEVSDAVGNWRTVPAGGYTQVLRRDLTSPTRLIPLDSTDGFVAGDWVVLRADCSVQFIAEHKMEDYWSVPDNVPDDIKFLRQIIAVHPESSVIEIDVPIRYYLKMRDNARVYHAPPHQEEVGLEDFSIGNVESDKDGWASADYMVPGTGGYEAHNSFAIRFFATRNGWIRRVASYRPPVNQTQTHILSNGISMTHSAAITIEDCDFQWPQYGGGGGNGYMYRIHGSNEILVKNSAARNNRHGFAIALMQSSGNVLHSCLAQNTARQAGGNGVTGGRGSDHHMHLSQSSLIDDSQVDADWFEARYRGSAGTIPHGVTSVHSVFWNTEGTSYFPGKDTGGRDVDYIIRSGQARYGYVIGTRGAATGVRIDTVEQSLPQDHLEGLAKGNTLEPRSLYLDQLNRRLSSAYNQPPMIETPPTVSMRTKKGAVVHVALGDDGKGAGMTLSWEVLEGPGSATFTPLTDQSAQMDVETPGIYLVAVTADDGEYSVTAHFEVIAAQSPEIVTISSPGNASLSEANSDLSGGLLNTWSEGRGAVDYTFQISKYAVTIAEWDAFYNDPGANRQGTLWQEDYNWWNDGSTPTRSVGSNAPAVRFNIHQFAQYANWLTTGDATQGAYTIDSGGLITAVMSRQDILASGDRYYLVPTHDEWFKAAYYDVINEKYWNFANGTNDYPQKTTDSETGWNYDNALAGAWDVTFGTEEQNGTFNMMGNVREVVYHPAADFGALRGGRYSDDNRLRASNGDFATDPGITGDWGGRLVVIPAQRSLQWIGDSDANFATEENWSPTGVFTGNSLVFAEAGSAGSEVFNDLSPGFILGDITFTPDAAEFTLAGNRLTLDGGIKFADSPPAVITQTIDLDLILAGTRRITTAANGDIHLGGIISGPDYSLIKDGDGLLTLSGANEYTGGTVLLQGVLVAAHNSALGTGPLQMDGSEAVFSSDGQSRIFANDIELLASSGTFGGSGSGDLTFNGSLHWGDDTKSYTFVGITATFTGEWTGSAASGIRNILQGTGTTESIVVLDGARGDASKPVDIRDALTVRVNHAGSLGTDNTLPLRVTGGVHTGVLELEGGITLARTVEILGRTLSGAPALRNLSGENTVAVQLATGGNIYAIESAADPLIISELTGTTGSSRNLHITGGGDTILPHWNDRGEILKQGAGSLTISGGSNHSGPINVEGGTLLLAGDSPEATGVVTVSPGAAIGGGGSMGGDLDLLSGAKLVFNPTQTLDVLGLLSFGDFGINDLLGLDSSVAVGSYTLVSGDIETQNLSNIGLENAVLLGEGKYAHFADTQENFLLVVDQAEDYLNWISSYGLTGADSEMTAAPAGDGIKNLLKYALNLTPTKNVFAAPAGDGWSGLPVVNQVIEDGIAYLQMIYYVDPARRDIAVIPEASTGLGTATIWNEPVTTNRVNINAEGIEKWSARVTMDTIDARFLRLKVKKIIEFQKEVLEQP